MGNSVSIQTLCEADVILRGKFNGYDHTLQMSETGDYVYIFNDDTIIDAAPVEKLFPTEDNLCEINGIKYYMYQTIKYIP